MERAKVTRETAEFIDKVSLQEGCSRSEVIRRALDNYMGYEKSEVLDKVQQLEQRLREMQDHIDALGEFQRQQFTELFRYFGGRRRHRLKDAD